MRVVIEKSWPGFGDSSIFTARDEIGKLHRFVHSYASQLPSPGEIWEVQGEAKRHEKYGMQIHVTEAQWTQPSGRLLVDFLTKHESFRGIGLGVTRASALWQKFGDGLFDILDDANTEALKEVDKLPSETIQPLVDTWQVVMAEGNIIRWLTAYEFPLTLARKILEHYGRDALDKVQKNPYKLLAFVSFKRCDEAAQKLRIQQDDPRRYVAVIQECLYRNLDRGHTRMSVDDLQQQAREFFTGERGRMASEAVEEAEQQKAIHVGQGYASTLGVRILEIDAMERFEALIEVTDTEQIELFPGARAEDIRAAIAAFEKEAGYQLNEAQQQAIKMAMTHRFSVLTGGAGVGKTTVLRALVNHYKESLYLMALTGQAAKRMMEATGHPAYTIARFIKSVAKDIDSDTTPLIVIDESSMLDLPLTTRLLRALPSNARMLLVGDPEQLPPVNFGLIFHKIVESNRVPQTHLTVINRQAESTGIPQVSRQIRDGVVPALPAYNGVKPGVSFIETEKRNILQTLIDLKADDPNAQILSPKNAGGVGIDNVNAMFNKIFRAGSTVDSLPFHGYAVGEPVVFKKNDYKLDLVNGSIGTITNISENSEQQWEVECDFTGEVKVITEEKLNHLKLAYGLTVHSAQGSQFDHVIVVVEDCQILDRTWVYTALTRGVTQVTFVGDLGAFDKAISEPPKARNREVYFHV